MDVFKSLGIDGYGFGTQVVGFLILLALLWRFGFPQISKIIDQRQADIESTYAKLDQDRAAMESSRREYEQRLANIEAEAREKINAAVKEAQELRVNLMADAHRESEAILERGRTESERERQKAFLEMRGQIVSLAVAAAGRVVGDSLNDARHTKMVDDFITEVGSGAVSSSSDRGVSGNTIGSNGAHSGGAVTL